MASIKCSAEFLTLTFRDKAIAISFKDNTIQNLEYNLSLQATKNSEKLGYNNINGKCNIYETVFLPCCDISNCCQWFVFSVGKCLLLWKTLDWSLIGNGTLQRSASKIRFSPDGSKIIVADKGGDVHIFLRDDISKRGSFLLGHLSLLLDVIITTDEKFTVTCDRDEKIRVSCYPNAYNIKSYCLGHEEFITCLQLLPHCQNTLMSSSGDGSLRLWNFQEGKELLNYACLNDVDVTKVSLDNDSSDNNTVIIKFETFLIDSNISGVCVLFDHYKDCIIYNVRGTDFNFTCSKLQTLNHNSFLRDICVNNELLWLISSEVKCEVCAFKWNKTNQKFESDIKNDKVNSAIISINKCLENIEIDFRNNFSVLYKKQFDNVQEYLKRKNAKLDESLKKNKMS